MNGPPCEPCGFSTTSPSSPRDIDQLPFEVTAHARVRPPGRTTHEQSFLCALCAFASSASGIRVPRKEPPFRGFGGFHVHLCHSGLAEGEIRNPGKEMNQVGTGLRGFWIPARATRHKPGRLAGMTQTRKNRFPRNEREESPLD